MIGAGGAAGQNDAANILKPALARGELRTIAATTWSEYKKYFEKDPALARRFQVVKVEEPTEEQCLVMMRGVTEFLEKHHKVRILDEGVAAAVKLSNRFIAGRQLPDKAVSVLDTACARLALGQSSTPAAIEDLKRQLDDLEVQDRILRREANTGVDHAERLAAVEQKKAAAQKSLDEINAKWEQASKLVSQIREIRAKLENVQRRATPTPMTPHPTRRPHQTVRYLTRRNAAPASLRRFRKSSAKSSPAGPASRSAKWFATKSAPSSNSTSISPSA